jgi:hypothetical protein
MASMGQSVICNPDDGKGHILTTDVQIHNREAANPHGICSAQRAPSARLLGRMLLPLESQSAASGSLSFAYVKGVRQRSEGVAALAGSPRRTAAHRASLELKAEGQRVRPRL